MQESSSSNGFAKLEWLPDELQRPCRSGSRWPVRAHHVISCQYSAVDTPAVLVVNASGVIQSCTPGAEELLGHSQSSVVGKTLDVIVPEEFRQRHWAGFNRAMASGRSFIDGQAAILPVLCGDGQVHRLAGRLSLLKYPTDSVMGAMVTYTSSAGISGTPTGWLRFGRGIPAPCGSRFDGPRQIDGSGAESPTAGTEAFARSRFRNDCQRRGHPVAKRGL